MAGYVVGRPASRLAGPSASGCPFAVSLLGSAIHSATKHLIAVRCRRWTCAHCAAVNRSILCARVAAGSPTKFLTLTSRALPGESPADVHKRCRPCVTRLIQFIRRCYGDCEAATILELFESGYPHWHLLMRGPYVPQRILSRVWKKYTGAGVVHIRRVDSARAAVAYVAKYVVKHCGVQKDRRLGRVVSFTRGYELSRKDRRVVPLCEWRRVKSHPEKVVESWPRGWNAVPVEYGWLFEPACEHVLWLEEEQRRERWQSWWLRVHYGPDPPSPAGRSRDVRQLFLPGFLATESTLPV